MADIRQWSALLDRFRTVLATAMDERGKRPEFVDTDDGPELEWVLYERGVMLDEVNRARAEQGKPEVTVDVVMRAERSAVGHVDYHRKFASYCAEIVLSEQPWVTKAGAQRWRG